MISFVQGIFVAFCFTAWKCSWVSVGQEEFFGSCEGTQMFCWQLHFHGTYTLSNPGNLGFWINPGQVSYFYLEDVAPNNFVSVYRDAPDSAGGMRLQEGLDHCIPQPACR